MDEAKKTKLVYSGELLLFAVVFLVLGILLLVGVFKPAGVFRQVFTYVTIAGGAWVIIDFFWTLFSPKRRGNYGIIDKILLLPVALAIIASDIVTLVLGFDETVEIHRIIVGILFLYIACDYLFQSIYHYFFPIPAILQSIEESKKEELEKEAKKESLLAQSENIEDKKDGEV